MKLRKSLYTATAVDPVRQIITNKDKSHIISMYIAFDNGLFYKSNENYNVKTP